MCETVSQRPAAVAGGGSEEAQAAKARLHAVVSVWRVLGNRTQWALRGAKPNGLGASDGELLSTMGDTLKIDTANAAMMRPFSGWKVSAFQARCGQQTNVQDRSDILFGAEATGVMCRARMSRMLAALETATGNFRAHELHNGDLYDDHDSQQYLMGIVDNDLD